MTFVPYRTIQRKRDGAELERSELGAFFRAYGVGELPDYQMSALLMAIYFRGMTRRELAALVDVMLRSGAVVDLSGVPGRKVDKHSTGGVGDKVSLPLAPLVSALGVPVPMISGRGLGHTGGTLDKLETIPGFRTSLSLAEFRGQLERLGCALIGQTEELAPLDRRLYALRDVTGTVESIPLIASSIMSKKLAEGIDALLLDVKRGSGAFLPELDRAIELAETMIAIGAEEGREVVALVTAMDRPLGEMVGNALEMEEAILTLRGGGPEDLRALTVAEAAEMLVLGGAARDLEAGRRSAAAALDDGRALAQMRRIVEAQGGDPRVLDDPSSLPRTRVRRVVEAWTNGYVQEVAARAVGEAAVALGAGRSRLDAAIDPGAGFRITARPGDPVRRGQPLATVYAGTEALAEAGEAALRQAIRLGPEPAAPPLPLISHRITAAGVEELRTSSSG
ncbi:MAG TPA: thymidine phosphorylase [Longimicrobiales bacterium]|nr:thymidine phosphorylase [Longimicrobiales bacterium]